MTDTPTAAIVGTGNIGTDLMVKLGRSRAIELRNVVGIDPASEGLAKARTAGYEASPTGVDGLLARGEPADIVFEATSVSAHVANAPRYKAAGIQAVDLSPAALGPFVVPVVNLLENADAPNVNLITCGGQATIPIVSAVSSVTEVPYAEFVASMASRSAGLGTRANIDEFTRTTRRSIELVGGATSCRARGCTVRHDGPGRSGRLPRPQQPRTRHCELRARLPSRARQIDGATAALGAGSGNSPTEVLATVFERLGIPTGIDLDAILAAAEDVVRPYMHHIPTADRPSAVTGYAGVYSSFLLHAQRAAERYGVPAHEVPTEAGRRRLVGGQEDLLIDIALSLRDGTTHAGDAQAAAR